ncbi:hypothetical protein [Aureivirga sp. CE67]|uniref:hypothetical protein n=1 Tax=Aureivirga sp. CE67 TaxID=1788983 RepID=UPI0018CB60E3|nr:hypothetical protein [Aureivirga sp. CE67]
MKIFSLNVLFILTVLLCSKEAISQNENSRFLFGFGINAISFNSYDVDEKITDPVTLETQTITKNIKGNFSDYYNPKYFNIHPTSIRLNAAYFITKGISAQFGFSLNSIDKFLEQEVKTQDLSYFSISLGTKYNIARVTGKDGFGNKEWFAPFAGVKYGMVFLDKGKSNYYDFELGTNLWVSETVGFNIQTEFKNTLKTEEVKKHFQHSLGIVLRLDSDADKDGVKGRKDKCPKIYGPKALDGCPDSDGDGITDREDKCPLEKGTKENNGCPEN